MYIDRQRRKRRSPLLIVVGLILLVGAAYAINQQASLIDIRNPLVPPEPTPTPTRSALSYLADAESLYANGQIVEASAAYAAVVALEPANDEALRWQAKLEALRGHASKAVVLSLIHISEPTRPY